MSAITKALRKVLDTDPSNWENRHALIEAYLKEDLKNEACMLLNEVDSLPEDEPSLISAAISYAIAGSPADARGIIQPVLDANPANADAHLGLASIAHLDGDSATAMRHYITATALNPALSDPELEASYGAILGPQSTQPPQPEAPVAEPVPEPAAVEAPEVETPTEEPEPDPVLDAKTQTVPLQSDAEEVVEAVEAVPEVEEPEPEAIIEEVPIEPESDPVAEESPEVEEVEIVEDLEAETASADIPAEVEPASELAEAAGGFEPSPQAVEEAPAEPAPEPTPKPEPEPAPGTMVVRKKSPDPVDPHFAEVSEWKHHIDHPPEDAEADAPEKDDGEDFEGELEYLKRCHDEAEDSKKRAMARDKLASLTLTIMLHVGVFLILGLVVISVPRDVPPQIVASMSQEAPEDMIQPQRIQRAQIRASTSATSNTQVVAAVAASNMAMSNTDFDGVANNPAHGMEFSPSMSFGAESSIKSKMMFGQKLEGDVLGVILDVSGSMAEYLPMVIKEVDKSFKNAPIVYVNHAGMLGGTTNTECYPIVKDEVLPSWPKEWNKGRNSPYWFLWGDLPRKAPQRYVDRLIETFKTRPNMFIARGGNNRVGAAADFLTEQKCDSLYIFSDFEDFVDEEYCVDLGQRLGRARVRTYIQPAAALTEHFGVVKNKVANRSRGKALPPLTEILRPAQDKPAPIMVEVEKEVPIPDGVQFATARAEMEAKNVWYYSYWGGNNNEHFKDVLEVVEYPLFDIVIRGPEARAYIFMKDDDGGYIQNPITFGYHSRKPYLDSDEKWRTRRRKFIRNLEPPKLDDKEFTWKMLLEDEIEFEVIFWFKEDSMTATYVAEKPPNGEGDGAMIYFFVPPLARESKDMYYSIDFPDGLSLEDLRLAMTNNKANFYLPAQAEDRLGTSWSRLGFGRGANWCPYNVIYRDLPTGVREVMVEGPSFGPRKLEARTTSNNLLLSTGNRADMEMWEGFSCRLARPGDRRERVSKLEAIRFTIE